VRRPSMDPPPSRAPLRLAPEDVEAIAQRVAELIGPRARIGLVDVDEICRRFRIVLAAHLLDRARRSFQVEPEAWPPTACRQSASSADSR
jgi:hypothetical protein